MIDTLLRLLAPHPCLSCGEIGPILCSDCKYNITRDFRTVCIVCDLRCPRGICGVHRSPCDAMWYVGLRKDALQRLVGTYKFNGTKSAARELADLLHMCLPALPKDTIITCVPTHPRRIRERGYDHMAHLARLFAGRRKLPYIPLLSRTRYFVQHNSTRSERLKQVRGAYTVLHPLSADSTYLLLDDVYTTGATVSQASNVLKEAGARNVFVAVIVKQPLD